MTEISKLLTKETFSSKILEYYKEKNYDSMIDCVSDFFEENNIDPSNANKFLTKEIIGIIKKEANEKNLIVKRRK
ncbi:MAG: late promoter transcription accessory protein [Thermoplasmata archaeon]